MRPRETILELIKDLANQDLGKIISYIKFVRYEEQKTLILELDDEKEIIEIMKSDEWYTNDDVQKMIEDMPNE